VSVSDQKEAEGDQAVDGARHGAGIARAASRYLASAEGGLAALKGGVGGKNCATGGAAAGRIRSPLENGAYAASSLRSGVSCNSGLFRAAAAKHRRCVASPARHMAAW